VDAVGAGCLLVNREVFTKIRDMPVERAAPWFQETVYHDRLMGEDFTFCMRAAAAGYKIAVNTSVRFGHIKAKVV